MLRRLRRGREPHVKLVHSKVIEKYEHLDVLWAVDAVDKVGKEVRDVFGRLCRRTPGNCVDPYWEQKIQQEQNGSIEKEKSE